MTVDKIKEKIGIYKFLLAFMFAMLSSCVGFLISSSWENLSLNFLVGITAIFAVANSIFLWQEINKLIEQL